MSRSLMPRRWLFASALALALALALAMTARAPPATAQADITPVALAGVGTSTTLAAPARRIVSLAPHLTELLFAAGAGDRVVGASTWSDYPPAARAIARIGDSHAFDIERILALRPDLIVAWDAGNAPRHVGQLRRLGIPIHVEGAARLDDIGAALERLGRLAGTEPVAREAARQYRQRLAGLRARPTGLPPVRVFHQVWDEPLMTINGQHPVSDLIAACGGENVFADAPALAPVVSREAVLRTAPAVITAAAVDDGSDPFAAWRRWPGLPALASGLLVALPADAISRLSPRLLDAAEPLCDAIAEARRHR